MYRQIQGRIKQLVGAGDWQPGSEIPSIRALAVALRVSLITVKRAYLELERDGVILTRQGKGSQVAPQAELADELRRERLASNLEEACRSAAELGLNPQELVAELHKARKKLESP